MKQIQIIGHLGKDAQVQTVKKGYTVQINVAVTDAYKNEKDEKVENTDWFTCFKFFRNDPKEFVQYLKKGTKIFVQGKPSFAISNTAKGVFHNLTINVDLLKIVSFVDDKTS
jgi:single-strand DNA-binding protein